jgi:hypothetical protein
LTRNTSRKFAVSVEKSMSRKRRQFKDEYVLEEAVSDEVYDFF